ncbi:MAG: dihydrofolate reductase [Firmicutes bacterium]|nr:dihydrofolate reductase [Bacillota bacterium]
MKKIEELGYEIIIKKEKNLTFTHELKDVEILVCYNPFTTLDIKKMKKLKWIQLSSIGIDQAPINYIRKNNIILTNNKGGYSIPMGEWIVLKILELYKKSHQFYKKQENKRWKIDTNVLELYGKTIGFLGTGSIAKEAAKRLSGFNVKTLGLNTNGTSTKYFDKCFSNEEIKKMLTLSDVIVLSLPYTEKTHNFVNEDIFNMMKDRVFFINISRGNIVDETALIENLKRGKIKGAALDVFENEPLNNDNPLWSMDNVIITPHNSWVSEMRNQRRFEIIYENMKKYSNNDKPNNIVNLNRGY